MKNSLVQVNNGQIIVSSRQIAKDFSKEHKNLLRDIGGMLKNEHTKKMFCKVFYMNEQNGQEYPEYLMNRDGFSLLVMGFTGSKALEWKLKYIEAFNAMEAELREKAAKPADTLKAERLAVMKRNAKVREANLWAKLAQGGNETFKQVCRTYAANILAEKEVIALPEASEKTYTATEIGTLLGISANKVGRLAVAHNLKTEKYGKWYHDKSRYSSKEVESFRYYENAIDEFKNILKAGDNHVAG